MSSEENITRSDIEELVSNPNLIHDLEVIDAEERLDDRKVVNLIINYGGDVDMTKLKELEVRRIECLNGRTLITLAKA